MSGCVLALLSVSMHVQHQYYPPIECNARVITSEPVYQSFNLKRPMSNRPSDPESRSIEYTGGIPTILMRPRPSRK